MSWKTNRRGRAFERLSVAYPIFWALFGYFVGYLKDGAPTAVLFTIVFGPVLLVTILIHELGHAFVAKRLGADVTDVLIWPLGGATLMDHNLGPKADFWIVVAGPLTHIPQLCFWLAQAPIAYHMGDCGPAPHFVLSDCEGSHWERLWYGITLFGMMFNILLFLLNLFPAFPLDGGRALLDVYLACGMTPRRAASLCVALSVPLTMTAGILFVIFWGDWLSFVVFFLLLLPNGAMIYLIWTDRLEEHPSFRNLHITRDDLDRSLLENSEGSATSASEIQL
ncbi:unnamed protein product [Ostreobium quekettii]|uniref:Peptidase M50 domain-containing protein n=1 Tax=Ostreobium quekettii TaxID=121088 RepID=A0A8S1ITC4_9CHLO|nr:unnamed protein product [Ostreobium quekettii]